MLDILLFLLYFPRFFFSLVTTVIVSYMLSACKGSEKIETRPPPNLRVWMTPPPPHPPIRGSGSAAGPDEIIYFSLSLRYLLNKTAHFTE